MPLTPREYLKKRRRLQKRYEDLGYALDTLQEDALEIPDPNPKSVTPVVNPCSVLPGEFLRHQIAPGEWFWAVVREVLSSDQYVDEDGSVHWFKNAYHLKPRVVVSEA